MKYSLKRTILWGLFAAAIIPLSIFAAQITKPHVDFKPGDLVDSAKINDNFNTLYTKVNDLDTSVTGLQTSGGNPVYGNESGAGNNAVYVKANGNVGIGTTSPSRQLTLEGSSEASIKMKQTTTGQSWYFQNTGAYLGLYDETASAYRLRIDTSGNVGIGTATPTAKLTLLKANTDTAADLQIIVQNDTTSGSSLRLRNASRNWKIWNPGSADTAGIGYLEFIDETAGVLRMWIDTSGGLAVANLGGSGNRAVYSDPAGTLTNTSSDGRLKKNIQNITERLDVISILKKLRGVYFNWDINNERSKKLGPQREIGMVAQEVEAVIPELIGTNSDGFKSFDYPKMVSFLVEVNKEQQKHIEELSKKFTTQNDSLKNDNNILKSDNDSLKKRFDLFESRLSLIENHGISKPAAVIDKVDGHWGF